MATAAVETAKAFFEIGKQIARHAYQDYASQTNPNSLNAQPITIQLHNPEQPSTLRPGIDVRDFKYQPEPGSESDMSSLDFHSIGYPNDQYQNAINKIVQNPTSDVDFDVLNKYIQHAPLVKLTEDLENGKFNDKIVDKVRAEIDERLKPIQYKMRTIANFVDPEFLKLDKIINANPNKYEKNLDVLKNAPDEFLKEVYNGLELQNLEYTSGVNYAIKPETLENFRNGYLKPVRELVKQRFGESNGSLNDEIKEKYTVNDKGNFDYQPSYYKLKSYILDEKPSLKKYLQLIGDTKPSLQTIELLNQNYPDSKLSGIMYDVSRLKVFDNYHDLENFENDLKKMNTTNLRTINTRIVPISGFSDKAKQLVQEMTERAIAYDIIDAKIESGSTISPEQMTKIVKYAKFMAKSSAKSAESFEKFAESSAKSAESFANTGKNQSKPGPGRDGFNYDQFEYRIPNIQETVVLATFVAKLILKSLKNIPESAKQILNNKPYVVKKFLETAQNVFSTQGESSLKQYLNNFVQAIKNNPVAAASIAASVAPTAVAAVRAIKRNRSNDDNNVINPDVNPEMRPNKRLRLQLANNPSVVAEPNNPSIFDDKTTIPYFIVGFNFYDMVKLNGFNNLLMRIKRFFDSKEVGKVIYLNSLHSSDAPFFKLTPTFYGMNNAIGGFNPILVQFTPFSKDQITLWVAVPKDHELQYRRWLKNVFIESVPAELQRYVSKTIKSFEFNNCKEFFVRKIDKNDYINRMPTTTINGINIYNWN